MKRITAILLLCLLLALPSALAETAATGGVPTDSANVRYSFATMNDRRERTVALPQKADLHLTMMCKEWEACQLLLQATTETQIIKIDSTFVDNGAGKRFPLKVYRVDYAIAEDGQEYPATLTAIKKTDQIILTPGMTQAFVLEFHTLDVGRTPAGNYSTVFRIKDEQDNILLEKEITITVYPIELPENGYMETSVGANGTFFSLTGNEEDSFHGYKGYSYDYFRWIEEIWGTDWLERQIPGIISDFQSIKEDENTLEEARTKIASIINGDWGAERTGNNTDAGIEALDVFTTVSGINIRDPFILIEDGVCYMYGTSGGKLLVFYGTNLQNLQRKTVFEDLEGKYTNGVYWAPEVYHLGDTYYMVATFKKDGDTRQSWLLTSDSPTGEFTPVHSLTPAEWESLDGTLWVEGDKRYLFFCHEWVQIEDGTICVTELDENMQPIGEVKTLFAASEAPWTTPYSENNYVTDGPFIYRLEDGRLLMGWSSFAGNGYAMGMAVSNSVWGPWTHLEKPLLDTWGGAGHGMFFEADGKLYVVYHTPNNANAERAVIRQIEEVNGRLQLIED